MRRPFRSSSGAWLPLHTKDILTCVRAVPRFRAEPEVFRSSHWFIGTGYSAELSCCLIGGVDRVLRTQKPVVPPTHIEVAGCASCRNVNVNDFDDRHNRIPTAHASFAREHSTTKTGARMPTRTMVLCCAAPRLRTPTPRALPDPSGGAAPRFCAPIPWALCACTRLQLCPHSSVSSTAHA